MRLPFKFNTKKTTNGYHFEIVDVDGCLVGVFYGSTNGMWDFVPGARQGLENVEFAIQAINNYKDETK